MVTLFFLAGRRVISLFWLARQSSEKLWTPSLRTIIPCMTFVPPKGAGAKVLRGIIVRKEGEPGNEASNLTSFLNLTLY